MTFMVQIIQAHGNSKKVMPETMITINKILMIPSLIKQTKAKWFLSCGGTILKQNFVGVKQKRDFIKPQIDK